PDLGLGSRGTKMAGLSPDGRWLYHLNSPPDGRSGLDRSRLRLRVWDVANRRHHWDMRFSGNWSNVAISPDNRLLAVGYENGSVELWDVQERELLFQWRPPGAGAIKHLAFTPEAAFLAASRDREPIHLLHLADLRNQLAQTGLDW